jgi:HlyD family secretion protein
MGKPKKRRKIIVFLVIGLVLVGLSVLAVVRKKEVVITVETEKVGRRTINELVPANGKIQPVVQVNISPEVSGEIVELPVKEGQPVKKGDLILKIKPDFYIAARNQAEASYRAALAAQDSAEASLRKAEADFKRNTDLSRAKLVSDSDFDAVVATYDVAKAQLISAKDQVEVAKASLASAEEELAKTTIVSPLTGTVSKLNSELGERVLGTVQNIGTEVMTISDLNEMEARVDIGEMDVVLIEAGQSVRLEVDAFKDRKFTGVVTDIANSAKGSGTSSAATTTSSQEATKFEVRIRLKEKAAFRPGMSVTADIETRSRTNVLAVPIASVTTRLPKEPDKKTGTNGTAVKSPATNATAGKSTATNPVALMAAASDTVTLKAAATNCAPGGTNVPGSNSLALVAGTNTSADGTNTLADAKKTKEPAKPIEVVFVVEGDRAKMLPVKIGISDDSYWEVTEGLKEGQEIVSGGYRAITRDLEDGKRIHKGTVVPEKDEKK